VSGVWCLSRGAGAVGEVASALPADIQLDGQLHSNIYNHQGVQLLAPSKLMHTSHPPWSIPP
jgi:hypothetical protein